MNGIIVGGANVEGVDASPCKDDLVILSISSLVFMKRWVGGMHTIGIAFSAGAGSQTSIGTDGGQFARLSAQHLARGGAALK